MIKKETIHYYKKKLFMYSMLMLTMFLFVGCNRANNNSEISIDMCGIELSENLNFEVVASILYAEAKLKEGTTFAAMDLNQILQSEGLFVDLNYQYMVYSFHIKNVSNSSVAVDYYLGLTTVDNNLDEKVRFLVIEDNGIKGIHQKRNLLNVHQIPAEIPFLTEQTVFEDSFNDF